VSVSADKLFVHQSAKLVYYKDQVGNFMFTAGCYVKKYNNGGVSIKIANQRFLCPGNDE